jgi:adenosine kinase
MMMDILCTGSVAYDYLMTFPGYFKDHLIPEKLECVSLSFLVDSMVRQRGGIAPNIAYTLALLGERPRLLATVGEDFEDYRKWLEAKGIDTSGVKVIPGEYTASFFANTDRCNAQIASFYTGAMAHAAELSITDLKERPDLVVISPNDPSAMEKYANECKAAGIDYLYDPSQQIVRLDGAELQRCFEGATLLFVNDYEFEMLQKKTGKKPDEIKSSVGILVVTLGEKGAVIYHDNHEYRVSVAPPKQILDPTGVGDAFRGGFLKGYAARMDFQTCGQMGALAATYCLEQCGTQSHSYTLAEFVARYRQYFDDKGKLDQLL